MRRRIAIRQFRNHAGARKGLTNPGSGCKLNRLKTIGGRGGMADTADLKSAAHKAYGFKSRRPHQTNIIRTFFQ